MLAVSFGTVTGANGREGSSTSLARSSSKESLKAMAISGTSLELGTGRVAAAPQTSRLLVARVRRQIKDFILV